MRDEEVVDRALTDMYEALRKAKEQGDGVEIRSFEGQIYALKWVLERG